MNNEHDTVASNRIFYNPSNSYLSFEFSTRYIFFSHLNADGKWIICNMCGYFFSFVIMLFFLTCWNVIWFNCQQDKDSFLIFILMILDIWLNDFIQCDLRMIHCMLNSVLCRFMIHWTDQERRKTCYTFRSFDKVVKPFDCCHRTWSEIIIFNIFLFAHREQFELFLFSLYEGHEGKTNRINKIET